MYFHNYRFIFLFLIYLINLAVDFVLKKHPINKRYIGNLQYFKDFCPTSNDMESINYNLPCL